jgi:hypothetical protein
MQAPAFRAGVGCGMAGGSMGDWIQEYGKSLQERLGRSDPAFELAADDAEALLGLAGTVAHKTGDRTNAPLATFLAGRFAEARAAEGVPAVRAVAEASEVACLLLSPES